MSIVSSTTESLLSRIQCMKFFNSVGTVVSEFVVRDWIQAVELAESEQWYQLCDHARFLITRSAASDLNWNEKIRFLKSKLVPVSSQVHCDLTNAGVETVLATRVCDELRCQLLMVGAELETHDQREIRLFRSIWDWLEKGHFPCYWKGDYPNGSLIVY